MTPGTEELPTEMGAQHTPGPWKEGIDGNPRVYGPDGMGEHSGLVAVVLKGRGNVRLIAAAPELLDALKLVADTYGFDPSVDSSIWQTVFAAIAKAEAGA
jgi:hypothetical protein